MIIEMTILLKLFEKILYVLSHTNVHAHERDYKGILQYKHFSHTAIYASPKSLVFDT